MSALTSKLDSSASALASTGSDRRAHPRSQWKGTASVRILPDGPDFVGVLQDLSEGGCAIKVGFTVPAQVGTRLEIEMIVRGVNFKRTGVLRNIQIIRRTEQETRAGVEFVEDNSPDAHRYRMLTRNLIAQEKSAASAPVSETLMRKLWSKLTGA